MSKKTFWVESFHYKKGDPLPLDFIAIKRDVESFYRILGKELGNDPDNKFLYPGILKQIENLPGDEGTIFYHVIKDEE
jgi:hypothetical protein